MKHTLAVPVNNPIDFDDARETALNKGMEFFGVNEDALQVQVNCVPSFGIYVCNCIVTCTEDDD